MAPGVDKQGGRAAFGRSALRPGSLQRPRCCGRGALARLPPACRSSSGARCSVDGEGSSEPEGRRRCIPIAVAVLCGQGVCWEWAMHCGLLHVAQITFSWGSCRDSMRTAVCIALVFRARF